MPNYGKDDHNGKSWGYGHLKLSHLLAKVVEDHSKQKKVTLFIHDWGSYYGFHLMAHRPELVSRIITLDIGGYSGFGFWHNASIFFYQLFVTECFFLGDPVGTWFVRFAFGKSAAHRPTNELRAQLCYSYFYKLFTTLPTLNFDFDKIPVFYIYGGKKAFNFHTNKWIADLESAEKCRVLEFDTDHYIMIEAPDELNKVVAEWLNEK